jgi:hypothetical protein
MLNQLNQLKAIGGAERINFSIQFITDNKARVILTSQVNAAATGQLADLLRSPIVLTGSLADIDIMLTNELFNLAEQASSIDITAPLAPNTTHTEPAATYQEDDVELDDESL